MPDSFEQDLDQFAGSLVEFGDARSALLHGFHKVISTDWLETHSHIQLIEDHMLKWPMLDYRIIVEYMHPGTYNLRHMPQHLWDMYNGLDLKVLKRIPTKNTVEFGLYATTNTAKFKEYDELVDAYNQKQELEHASDLKIDPVTGDFVDKDRRLVRETKIISKHMPKWNNYKPGRLDEIPGIPAPVQNKRLVATITCSLVAADEVFTLETIAKDLRGELLWWNTIKDEDLSECTRKTIHGLFGNPDVESEGNYLEGIPMLLRGDKAAAAKGNNRSSELDTKLKVPKRNNEVSAQRWTSAGRLTGHLIPGVSFVIGIGFMFKSMTGDLFASNALYSAFLFGVVIPVSSRLLAKVCESRVVAAEMRDVL